VAELRNITCRIHLRVAPEDSRLAIAVVLVGL
jgi:hypothetical protein